VLHICLLLAAPALTDGSTHASLPLDGSTTPMMVARPKFLHSTSRVPLQCCRTLVAMRLCFIAALRFICSNVAHLSHAASPPPLAVAHDLAYLHRRRPQFRCGARGATGHWRGGPSGWWRLTGGPLGHMTMKWGSTTTPSGQRVATPRAVV
jgi:hypothetical protein